METECNLKKGSEANSGIKMKNNKEQFYLKDLIFLVTEDAENAKLKLDNISDQNRDDKLYYSGYLSAYEDIISLMKSQAKAFDLKLPN